ncbi:nuclear transport factor 2 family protein [Plebeiibacterium sediminum]|uniref:Nuclear transport factor 2 family protein n=1 Tax=Plebeiibacterium sediminum TaxID=2992112 RepID=A0AAE3M3K8_9BACT|nr:nuclear transport factor 2 family protein [Plebeiobacterium sediminum]MCW3786439.1 nuclear transport factor 2 family protein [Plebeiobacterium sediminum]
MKTKNLLLMVGLGLLFSCQDMKKNDDPKVLEQLIISYFDGVKDKDLDKMNSVTTEDFVLFENGSVWNNDSLYNFLNQLPPYVATFSFNNIHVNIGSEYGNINYFNHMDMVLNDTIEDNYDWIESASFKKVEGEWKMNFLHSTVRQ